MLFAYLIFPRFSKLFIYIYIYLFKFPTRESNPEPYVVNTDNRPLDHRDDSTKYTKNNCWSHFGVMPSQTP